jgi:hypothetical protein
MSSDRIAAQTRRPTFFRRIVPLLLILVSFFISVLLVEVFCRLFIPSLTLVDSDKALHSIIFLDGRDTIFRNEEDIFTYVPHSELRNLTVFFSDRDFEIEYDYRFHSNNLGLVQETDIIPERESVLLLGDSFTEGQGGPPWFRQISPEIEKLGYQPINGGLMGTGFQQWVNLGRYLAAKHIRIHKIIVPFISDDYHRPVWNFTEANFQCLSSLADCHVDESYYYRLPPQEQLSSWVDKIRTARVPMAKQVWARAAALLPASFHVYHYFKQRVGNPALARLERAEPQSRAAIGELIKRFGAENVLFVHLPQREEINNGPSGLGLKARQAIDEAGGKWLDGFAMCRLTEKDYYVNDAHPNAAGYRKIASCITEVIEQAISPLR